jgi:hypothetical protein
LSLVEGSKVRGRESTYLNPRSFVYHPPFPAGEAKWRFGINPNFGIIMAAERGFTGRSSFGNPNFKTRQPEPSVAAGRRLHRVGWRKD